MADMTFDWVYLFLLGSLMFLSFLPIDEKTLANVIFGRKLVRGRHSTNS